MLCYFIAFLIGIVFHIYLPGLRARFFAALMNYFTENSSNVLGPFKTELLGEIKSLKTKVPGNEDSLKILEIGVGTGANFKYYPDGCHLTVVDPNPHFKSYYNTNRSKFPQIKSEEIIVAGGENMYMVEDSSVDVVVITLVLCSVQDVKKVLEQAKRVLVPGGKMYFVGLVAEFDPSERRRKFLQDVLTNTGIWPGIMDGCHLNRRIYDDINEAGFAELQLEKTHIKDAQAIDYLIGSLSVGVATK